LTEFTSTREELLASLSKYKSLLEQRKQALTQLSSTSAEMRSVLCSDIAPDIGDLLERRESECRHLETVNPREAGTDKAILRAAKALAANTSDELGRLASSAVSLYADTQNLGREVLTCQAECEAILKDRIDATAQAIRESKQRRRLDAVYGPACKHRAPAFIDKQQ